ncbi:hypothetical protein [Psychrobacillus antarcticus]|uniref:hypothetical protein n=1 Tax=Psychrobacillus antarcticus TaxID=2879115 RepID=UPI002407E05B|nr:hypothetical protein [Psychrobacillus antarcticus]
MNKFIECSDEIETVVGEGLYTESGQFIHVVTSDNTVANLFEQRLQDKSMVKKLTFKKESGTTVFSGPFMVKDCDGSEIGEWSIKLKKRLRR